MLCFCFRDVKYKMPCSCFRDVKYKNAVVCLKYGKLIVCKVKTYYPLALSVCFDLCLMNCLAVGILLSEIVYKNVVHTK